MKLDALYDLLENNSARGIRGGIQWNDMALCRWGMDA